MSLAQPNESCPCRHLGNCPIRQWSTHEALTALQTLEDVLKAIFEAHDQQLVQHWTLVDRSPEPDEPCDDLQLFDDDDLHY